jgi:hypothetical protein
VTCKRIQRFSTWVGIYYFTALGFVLFPHRTFAQAPPPEKGIYHSDIDDLLTVEKVSVLPFTDNLQGIYARPLEAHFIELVDKMHRWNYIAATTSGALMSPEELEESPAKAQALGSGLNVDAFFVSRVTKGPNGITIHLSLFLSRDGKLISQAILKDYKQFNISELKEQMQRLLTEIVTRLPYSGRILSREGNRVTVNLGLRDGLQAGQVLSVIQIIQAQRHPKFNFLIRTDKEIFGRVKVLKVDETLSFGVVVTEKERGAIQKNAKIGPIDYVSYGGDQSLSTTTNISPEEELANRDESKLSFGKDAKAWKPAPAPTFGQIGGRFGLSRMQQNAELASAGGMSGTDNFAPSIAIDGELWVTPEWTFFARIKQGIAQIDNPRSGSSPAKLNQTVSSYEGGFGYMFRFGNYAWSPYVEPILGYFTYRKFTDASSPAVFSTMDYSGFKYGVRGATPIGLGENMGAGGEFTMAWKPSLSESPGTSGSSSNDAVDFAIFGYKRLGERLKVQLQLEFSIYSSTFSGTGTRGANSATSASSRDVTLSGGAYYMF